MVWGLGFETDRYDLPAPGSTHDNENVVNDAIVTSAGVNSGNSGYVVDDDQPHPIYGWLTLHWFDRATLFRNAERNIAVAGVAQLRAKERP